MTFDSIELIDELSKAWEISEETQNRLLTNTAQQSSEVQTPLQQGPSLATVSISTVSTYIARKSLHNFVVPPFASHWGVVIDFASAPQTSRTLYHLTFDPETREVGLQVENWKSRWSKHQVVQVGTTLYGYPEVNAIGNLHHEVGFNGTYRAWTSQGVRKAWQLPFHFLELPALCVALHQAHMPTAWKYWLWDSDFRGGDKTCMASKPNTNVQALCAIVVPSPVVTTQWRQEKARTKELIERVLNRSTDRIAEDDLTAISENAVDYIVYTSLTDPKSEEQILQQLGDHSPKRRTAFSYLVLMQGFYHRWMDKIFGESN